ncbi:hypothetical protein [Saccharopolyspora rectivirgula]|jgi:hypothetical protein|uniref:Proteinase inhibitor I42 chagasin domain-containing protein n=1 Tax=Saccharopolyspora rectivirgula TaxID=28042 RepID=A0A073AZ50_9PSEU|nr:hypothetical protein [Saccharopolyspora rectivirgula]KEI44630.1 hypothetical protein GU90_08965 [Saccharopolyspora rectivirgula]
MRSIKKLAAATLIGGLALTVPAPALAVADDPAPASASTATAKAPLTSDKSVVKPGETVVLRLDHGPEGLNWISSKAFVKDREHPMGADEGVAQVVSDRAGQAEAVATIADVPAGTYTVHTRVGGGAGPTMTITVVR